jgi:hypothetical protein
MNYGKSKDEEMSVAEKGEEYKVVKEQWIDVVIHGHETLEDACNKTFGLVVERQKEFPNAPIRLKVEIEGHRVNGHFDNDMQDFQGFLQSGLWQNRFISALETPSFGIQHSRKAQRAIPEGSQLLITPSYLGITAPGCADAHTLSKSDIEKLVNDTGNDPLQIGKSTLS